MRTLYLQIVACQQLEDMCLRMVDRLVDNGLLQKSSILYLAVTQLIVCTLEDMVDFFNNLIVYIQTICNPFH